MSEIPPEVMPAPLPMLTAITVTDTEPRYVILQVIDPSGQKVMFFPADLAAKVGGQLRAAGKQAASGLIVPGGFIMPNGAGGAS